MPRITFDMETQQHSEWCWAAVTVSVDHYFNNKSTWCQCRLVTHVAKLKKGLNLNVKNCGTCQKPDPVPEKCNKTFYLDKALRTVRRLKGKARDAPLSFHQVDKEIKARRPVCAEITWGKGPDAHAVVISGCVRAKSGRRYVDVEDPLSGSSTWLLEEFLTNYQYANGRWTATFPV